jgi:hypothetical protein
LPFVVSEERLAVGGTDVRRSLAIFRQTDSWSNRLRRAVGSLDTHLSPLALLRSPLVTGLGSNAAPVF